jgi:hypothetical protein
VRWARNQPSAGKKKADVLSDAERRVLALVQAQIYQDDPELGIALLRMRPPRPVHRTRLG